MHINSVVEPATAAPATAAPTAPTGRKRKRRDDGPGLPHASLSDLGSIKALWVEYVGEDGTGGLRQRAKENPKWYGEDNQPSRQLVHQKMFFYRESTHRPIMPA